MWAPHGTLSAVNPRDRNIAQVRAVLAGGSACAQVLAGMHGNRPWQVMLMIVTGALAAGALWPLKKLIHAKDRPFMGSKKILHDSLIVIDGRSRGPGDDRLEGIFPSLSVRYSHRLGQVALSC